MRALAEMIVAAQRNRYEQQRRQQHNAGAMAETMPKRSHLTAGYRFAG